MPCCVKSCSYSGSGYSGSKQVKTKYCVEYRLYVFPKNQKMRQKWTEILKVPPGLAGSSQICSRHFEDECFEGNNGRKNRKLKTNAKPTLFLGQNKLTYGKPESLIKEEVIEIDEVNDMPMLAENEVEEEYFNDTKYIKEEMLEVQIKEESLDLIPSQKCPTRRG